MAAGNIFGQIALFWHKIPLNKRYKVSGKASDVTLADIPGDLRKDRKILTFISAHNAFQQRKRDTSIQC
jgi:hypothetical protein